MQSGSDRTVAAFLEGDPAVIEEVRAVVAAVIAGFDFRDGELKRDLVQESIGRMMVSLRAERFRGDASLTTYAHSVARYTCIEHLRRRRREVLPEGETETTGNHEPEESLLRVERHRHNLRAFAVLPSEARELLYLVFVEGLSYEQMGQRLGVSVGAVKSRVHRCRLQLRRLAESNGNPGSPAPRGESDTSRGEQRDAVRPQR